MNPDSSRPQPLSAETITSAVTTFIRTTGGVAQSQTELLEIAKPFIDEGNAVSYGRRINAEIAENAAIFDHFINQLADLGYAIGVRDSNNQVLPVKKLIFDRDIKRYSLECSWQNETHALIFDDTISFAMLKAYVGRQATNPNTAA